MKKPLAILRYILIPFLTLFIAGCNDAPPDDVYKLLEQKAKVKTFPLTIVLTEPLAGEAFPDDLKTLCKYSAAVCKTLPAAGILRLGPDQYFTFNAISSLDVSGKEGDDEATIARSVQNQVSAWYLKTKLRDFDSLRSANKPEFNSASLTAQYVLNNKDSIYFFSSKASDPSVIFAAGRSFNVFKNVSELRRIIDEQICKKSFSVSVFYTPSDSGTRPVATGIYAGDTCVGGSKYEKLNDGKGNLFVGKLIQKNSRSCGFAFPAGVAGDTCINFSKYQKMHDGRGGFKSGNLLEKNSPSCGYLPPKIKAESDLKVPSANRQAAPLPGAQPVRTAPVGRTSPVQTAPVSRTSPVQAAAVAGNPLVKAAPVARNPSVQSVLVARIPPAKAAPNVRSPAETAPARDNAKPTATSAALPLPTSTDKRCAKTSEPMCEQDERGNYTGRRIQYCYNNAGKRVRTVVLKKCDGDCRCLGD